MSRNVGNTDLASLWSGDYVILVHWSPEDLTTDLVCGEIGGGIQGEAPKVDATGGLTHSHMPVSGHGLPAAIDTTGTYLFIALGGLAIVSALTANALRKSGR